MKTYARPRPLGKTSFEPIRTVRYLDDSDVFEVEFESGDTYRVDHSSLRNANGLKGSGEVDTVWIEAEMRAGFLVRYRNGECADCSWDFVREHPNAKS